MVPVSHAPMLADTWNWPKPTVTEYQSRSSVPISVTTVPPTTIHMLREILDISMRTLSLPDEL
jgi:hypothetical protein